MEKETIQQNEGIIRVGSVITLKSRNHRRYLVVKIGTDKDPNIETFSIPRKNFNKIDEKLLEKIDCIKTISIPKAGLSNVARVLNFTATEEQVNYLLKEHDKFIHGLYQSNKKYIVLKSKIKSCMTNDWIYNKLFSKLSNNSEINEIPTNEENIIYLYKKNYGEEKYNKLLQAAHNISDYGNLSRISNFDIDSMMITYLIDHDLVPQHILRSRDKKKFKPDPIYKRAIKYQNHYSTAIDREVMKMKENGYTTIEIIEVLTSLVNNDTPVIDEFITREKLIAENQERTAYLRKNLK